MPSNPKDVNWQIKIFTEIKRMIPRDPPWVTKSLKAMLKRKNKLYKNYKRHGYRDDDKIRLEAFRKECKKMRLKQADYHT